MLGRRRRRVPGTCGSAHDQSAAIDGRLAEAGCLSQLARVDNAVTTRHQLIDRLDRRSTTATQVELGAAVQRKCEALALAGQVHEMLTAQDEVLERLEDSSERQLRPAVARHDRIRISRRRLTGLSGPRRPRSHSPRTCVRSRVRGAHAFPPTGAPSSGLPRSLSREPRIARARRWTLLDAKWV